MKLKFILNLHRRIELKEIKLLIPKILRSYKKFTWNMKFGEKKNTCEKKRLKYEFKFKVKVFFS